MPSTSLSLNSSNNNGVSTTEKEAVTQEAKAKGQVKASGRAAKPTPPPKPTSERLAESVHLVTQLADVGIGKTHPHMVAFRAILNRWIREEDYSYNGRVDFDAYGRRGDLVLPSVKGHVAGLRLRAI